MRWTTKQPTKKGYYWVWSKYSIPRPIVVEVAPSLLGGLCAVVHTNYPEQINEEMAKSRITHWKGPLKTEPPKDAA